jgi:1-acyl-sn-glycerol-3-phosphate acyltransferase
MLRYTTATTLLLPLFRRKLKSVTGTEYLPAAGPAILAANHIDFLDAFFIAAAVKAGAHRPLANITKTRNYWWTGASIPVGGGDRSAILTAAQQRLQRGWFILNFVEGVRNTTNTLGSGRTGTARLAIATHLPVIPIGIRGYYSRNMNQAIARLFTQPPSVSVHIGQPVPSPNGDPEDRALVLQFTERIVRAVAPLASKNAPA